MNPLMNLDARLADLRPRLQSLHFRAFELLSESNTMMKLNEVYTFPLAGGHEIQIKPMERKRRKVCFWLRWEHDGVEMLDTKLHFSPKEGFVTGTTVRDDMAKIIALDVVQ